MRFVLLIVGLAACAQPKPDATTPPVAQRDCKGPVEAVHRIETLTPETQEKIEGAIALHCVRDEWSVEATSCMAAARSTEDAHTCMENRMTHAQAENLMHALSDITDEKPSTATPPTEPAAPPPAAGSQAAIAAAANDEGKAALMKQDYARASAKFRDAVARVPEPQYFFNLCVSLFQEGKFSEAMASCQGATKNNPSPALRTKIDALIVKVQDEAKAQGIRL